MTRKQINKAKSLLRPYSQSLTVFAIDGGLGLGVQFDDGSQACYWSLQSVEDKVAEMAERRELARQAYAEWNAAWDASGR